MKTRLLPFFLLVACFAGQKVFSQPFTNKGKEFWVGYGHHQYMEKGCNGTGGEEQIQNLVLYLSAEQAATVTVTIDSSGIGGVMSTWWRRTYTIPANTVISTDILAEGGTAATSWTTVAGSNGPMPKGSPFHGYDSRLITDAPPAGTGGQGLFRKKGIHIESNVPIVAYAHIYGSVSSGATMLMPTHTWGYSYTSVNSQQYNADRSYSWMYVVAKEDFTRVIITPSQNTRLSSVPANVPITVNLMKGQIYQIIGQADCPTGNGVQLTGTTVVSVPGSDGNCHPIAVFSGSSRTGGELNLCGSSGRDNDMQQLFPEQSWGMRYLTAPLSRSGNPAQANQFMSHVYKVIVKDPTTVVKVNGTQIPLASLIVGKYYQFVSGTADFIEADKPVMVAQFMASQGTACNPGLGDPEMVILSPIEQASKKVGFFRNTQENIQVNYVTLIVPTPGLPSLRIDNSAVFNHTYAHPNKPGYTVVVKGWVADPQQCIVTCDSAFNAITYGLGGAESYAYNAGTNIINLNGISSIHNVLDSTKNVSDFTCRKTPVQLSALIVYQPTQMIWKLSTLGSAVTPNADITVNNPVPVGTVTINNNVYYKYTLPGTYMFNVVGSNYIPVLATSPTVSGCTRTEELTLEVVVRESPVTNFTFNQSGACSNQVCFTGPTTAAVGFNAKYWRWSFPTGTTDSTQTPCVTFPGSGNYNIYHKIITDEGCVGDTTRSIPVTTATANPLVVNSPAPICEGASTTLTVSGGTTYNWTPATGLSATTGSSVTANPTVTTTYSVTSDVSGCTYVKTITVTVNPKPGPPTVTPTATVCQGDAFVLSAAATTGNTLTWYTNSGLTGGSATAPTVSTAAPGTQTYWVTQKTPEGCESNAATITLNVLASIASNTIGFDQQICSGTSPGALTDAATPVSGGNGTYAFQWQQSTDGGATWTNIAGATGVSYLPPAATGTIKYRRTVTSGPCSNTSNVVTITIQGSLAGLGISANQTICEGSTPNVIVGQTPTGGDGTFTYSWESSADNVNWTVIAGATGKDYTSPALNDTIYYRRKVTSGTCSGTSNVVTILVNPRPAGTITGPAAQCAYDAYSVNFTGTAGLPPYTLILNVTGPGGYTNTITQNISSNATTPVLIMPVNSAAGNYTITFTSLTDANNCSRSSFGSLNFVLHPRPIITLSPDPTICAGASTTLTAGGADTYTWSPSTGLSGTTGATVTANPTTNTTYTVTGTSNGCTGTGTVNVVVKPIPAKPAVVSPVTYCQGDGAVALSATAGAGNTLTWYDNSALTGGTATAYTPTTASPGTSLYYVTQTSADNCRSAAETITVVVQPSITGNAISADQTVCQGTSPAPISSAGSLNGGNGAFAYAWQQSTDGGTTWTLISGASTGTLTPSAAPGVIKYRRIVTSGQCTSTSNVVTITVLPQLANFGAGTDQTICESSLTPLQVGQTPTGGNGAYTYQWQSSTDQTTWTNIPGATGKDYQPPVLSGNTYYRRITTSGPCTVTSAAILITVKARPNGTLTGSTVCQYDAASVSFSATAGVAPYSVQVAVSGPGGYSNTVTQTVSGSSATIPVLPANSTPGSYNVLISSITDNNGCVRGGGFSSVAVIVNPRPVLTISPDVAICQGSSTNLTVSGATTYAWSPATGLNTTSGSTVVATPATNTSYIVTGTTNGCVNSGSVTVTVNPVPAKPTVTSPVNYCQDDAAAQLQATASAGNTLTYYNNAALTGGSSTPYTPSTLVADSLEYYVTQTNSFNCTSQPSEIIIAVQPKIAGNSISADQLLCAGSASTPIGSANPPTGGNNTYTYQWQQSINSGATWTNIAGANGLTYNPGTPATSTQYRRLVTSGMCSSTSNVVTVSVQGGVSNIGITGTQSVCNGGTPTLLDGQPAGAVSYQWESSPNNTTWTAIPGATGEDYQPGPLTATTYYRRKVSNGACSATSGPVTVTVNNLPMGTITGSTVCEYDAASVTFAATEGSAPYSVRLNITGPGGYSNTITQTVGSGSVTMPILPANSAPGAYSIALSSITDNNGCVRNTGLSGTIINVTARPVISLPPAVPACQGTSTTLTASGATTYTWSPATGLSATTGSSVIANPASTTTYTVTGTANGCTSTKDVTVTVNPRPGASFTVDNNVCQNSQATFVPSTSSPNVTSWRWDFGDGTGVQTYNDGYSFTRPYSTANTFNVKLVTVDANGCVSDTARQSITVRPIPSADFTMPVSICMPNGVASFTNRTSISDNSAVTYVWDFGDQSGTVTTTDPSHVYPANGPYNVTLTATSAYGCQDVASKVLGPNAFFEKPIAKFSVSPEALCQGMDNVFTDESTAPNSSVTSWRWNFDDGTSVVTSRNPTRRYKNPGTYEVQLVVINAVGCVSDTAKKEVNVYLQPIVDAGPSFVVTAGTIVNFKPKVNDTTLSFTWTPSADFADASKLTQTLVAFKDQTYTLTAIGDEGCSAWDTLVVKILNPIKIPNAFSPNGDGINDTWEIPYLKDYPGATVHVYNRFGQQVYMTYGYGRPWDGTYKGNALPVATYYYVITLQNGFTPISGSVTIVK